jgi:hypothetical protein
VTLHSDPAAPRKPRRLGLVIPWGVALALVAGWSVAWFWLAMAAGQRIDAAGAALRAGGWQASWSERTTSGYPFRLDVDLEDLRLADPSGWAVAAPSLKAEAYVFAPTRWVVAVPDGFAFTRPDGGPVSVTARRLRFSLNSWDQHPPRLSLEGEDITFAAAPGAKPFSLAAAKDLQFYTRAGPQDQGEVLLLVQGGAAAPGTWLARIAQGAPVAITADAVMSHVSAFHGAGWREAVSGWALAGGVLGVHQLTLAAGGAGFDARSGAVGVDPDGRLTGALPVTVNQPTRVLAALAGGKAKLASGEPPQSVRLDLAGGAASIAGLKLGPAPRVF